MKVFLRYESYQIFQFWAHFMFFNKNPPRIYKIWFMGFLPCFVLLRLVFCLKSPYYFEIKIINMWELNNVLVMHEANHTQEFLLNLIGDFQETF